MEKNHANIIAVVKKAIVQYPDDNIEVSREFASTRGSGAENNDYISSGAWKGIFSKEPAEEFIYKSAREIGAELVLMYETTVPGGGRGKHRVYLFDAGSMRSFKKSNKWKKGHLGKNLHRAIISVLRDYRSTR